MKRVGKRIRLVGAGAVWMWGGDALCCCVALVLVPRVFSLLLGRRKRPLPAQPYPRPYGKTGVLLMYITRAMKELTMTLRILSYNILWGGEDRLPLIARVIQMQQPDVVALLEANSRPKAEALSQQLGMSLIFGNANSAFHVAWLSRLPILQTENYRLPVFAKTLLKIEIPWESSSLALFATHLQSGRDQKREDHRVVEMQAILDILQPLGNQPHVLVGDMNALHPTYHTNVAVNPHIEPGEKEEHPQEPPFPRQSIPLLLKAGYVDCYRMLHPTTPGYTYKLPTPGLRLDYIFAPPPLVQRLQACDIVTAGEAVIASDHFPIWAEFG